jgi:phosphoribosyl 1,2-cyclic phosphate phosphodiesterase
MTSPSFTSPGELEFTILGSGASSGVPRADGDWGVCDPTEPRNLRTRCSLLVRRRSPESGKSAGPDRDTTLLVDTAPELRQQALAAGVRRLDAAVFTHDHADQTHGLDDVRPFAQLMRQRIPCHMDRVTHDSLVSRFGYVFHGELGYPPICEGRLLPPHGQAWSVAGPSGEIPVVTFDCDHGAIRSVGYRFGDVAYCPDVVALPQASFEALAGLKVWIVDALRYTPHPTHSHLAQTLEWIERLAPEHAILTNMHIDLDYQTLARELPANVTPAYDGMRFTVG